MKIEVYVPYKEMKFIRAIVDAIGYKPWQKAVRRWISRHFAMQNAGFYGVPDIQIWISEMTWKEFKATIHYYVHLRPLRNWLARKRYLNGRIYTIDGEDVIEDEHGVIWVRGNEYEQDDGSLIRVWNKAKAK